MVNKFRETLRVMHTERQRYLGKLKKIRNKEEGAKTLRERKMRRQKRILRKKQAERG